MYAVVGTLYFVAVKISRSSADHPSKILNSKVDKFYTGITMIIQKNRHVRTSKQNLIHIRITCHREKPLSTSIKYRRFQGNYKKYMLAGILLHIIKLNWRTLTKVITVVAAINPLGPDGSYMIHESYGRNNRPGAKRLRLINERNFALSTNPLASGQLFLP